jgi:opacity protein-like surface antigen
MKILYTVFAFSLLLLSATHAEAGKSRLYLSGYMGLNVHPELEYTESVSSDMGDMELENGNNFAGALGLRITKNLSFEAELAYRKSDVANIQIRGGEETRMAGEIKTTTFMLTGIYDFDISWREVYPFLSLGAGIAWHNGEIDDVEGVTVDSSGDDVGFAWALGGGIKHDVREGLAFSGSYRYLGSSEIGFENATLDYTSHEFRLGMEYDLNTR